MTTHRCCLFRWPASGRVLVALALQLLAADGAQAQVSVPASAQATQIEARLALGQRIYREGLGMSGEPLAAQGAAQRRLTGKDVACAACHRRSGYGTSEGRFVIRPITGPALFHEQAVAVRSPRVKARLGTSLRPPYDEALLARAIRGGIDSAGKPLDPLMPRYLLSDEETAALSAYLHTLSAEASPGVDEQEIHFATVIQPGIAAERRRAMLEIMQAFVKDKNANMRSEDVRRDAGNMRMYRAWRKWILHVWELNGPAQTWGAQLEEHYRRQPVFALVGGLGAASWQPIHEFSEGREIPAVFALTDLPNLSGANLYNFYFSRGLALDAEVLATFLATQGEPGRVLQVYRRDEAGSVAAAALRADLLQRQGATLEDSVLEGAADAAFWRGVAATRPAAIVLWLGAQDLEAAQALGGDGQPAVYLSFNMLGGKLPEATIREGVNVRTIYPSDLPPRHDARLLRDKVWMHSKNIALADTALQFNTLFAMTVVSDVIGHIEDSFSRDLFVERVEHVVGQTPMASIYPQVSLGPGQRFAAKGSSIIQLRDAEKSKPKLLSTWIVP